MPNPLMVVFCLPGAHFSGKFLECWTGLVAWCLGHEIQPILSRRQSNNIYYTLEEITGMKDLVEVAYTGMGLKCW